MINKQITPLLRIGVFYDGTYFNKASNFYFYQHERRARLSIGGLHDLIRNEIAQREGVDIRYCQIVDAHYFRGRLSANEARERESLYIDRVVDDVLMNEGVVTHYLPLQRGQERGIDVWFALEAFELAMYKRFDVICLIAGDGDYVPLVRKLNTSGTRVMLVGFDYEYLRDGERYTSKASTHLIDESTYPVLLSSLIDDRTRRTDLYINNLFVPRPESGSAGALRHMAASNGAAASGSSAYRPASYSTSVAMPASTSATPATPAANPADGPAPSAVPAPGDAAPASAPETPAGNGFIFSLHEGYGFVQTDEGDRMFFHSSNLAAGIYFSMLLPGARVSFDEGFNQKGPCALDVRPAHARQSASASAD